MSVATKRAAAGSARKNAAASSAAKKAASAKDAAAITASTLPLDATPEEALAHGFAERVVRWGLASGASSSSLDALRTAARMTSLATSAGHVCIHLDDVALELPTFPGLFLRDTLLESMMIGTPARPGSMPLILDDHGRLYLHRYFDYERRLARRLMAQTRDIPPRVDASAKERLDALFTRRTPCAGNAPDWQKLAGALALTRRLTIISGGPGTGKTTTVVNLLACILAQDPSCRIRLAAPTGKAAARMNEAIRQQADRLSPEIRTLLPTEAYTVHRLLGVVPDSSEFRHRADNPLPVDLLVVDEASMLDLALATKLFEAVPLSARIILLGDKDQLSAVEAGAVFSELSADPSLSAGCVATLASLTGIEAERIAPPEPVASSALRDSVVWFTENFRFSAASGIGKLAALVNAGDADGAIRLLRSMDGAESDSLDSDSGAAVVSRDRLADHTVRWIEDASPTPSTETMRAIFEGIDPYLQAARTNIDDKAALFEAFGRFRVLCAEREGPRGVEGINRAVSQHFRRSLAREDDPGNRSEWYAGRPVMVLRNDYVLKLFNGDTGLVLPDASGAMMAWFPESGGDGDAFRAVAPVRLPAHETAFATTVHKAQGSEFGSVLLMLPAKVSRVVSRELVYTAVTRARDRAMIVGGVEVIEKAVASPTTRRSGLIDRLNETNEARSRD